MWNQQPSSSTEFSFCRCMQNHSIPSANKDLWKFLRTSSPNNIESRLLQTNTTILRHMYIRDAYRPTSNCEFRTTNAYITTIKIRISLHFAKCKSPQKYSNSRRSKRICMYCISTLSIPYARLHNSHIWKSQRQDILKVRSLRGIKANRNDGKQNYSTEKNKTNDPQPTWRWIIFSRTTKNIIDENLRKMEHLTEIWFNQGVE